MIPACGSNPCARCRPRRLQVSLKRALLSVATAAAGVIGTYGGLLAVAKPVLTIPTRVERADAIVVLGGDGAPRAAVAAALFRSGMAPWVLVSGDGDCLEIREVLVASGVPQKAIRIECSSRNTMENAEFSAAIMRSMEVRRALVVTSWYHSRRALGCFRKAAPVVEFMSVPASMNESVWHLAWYGGGSRIVLEYLKIGWYLLHYGVAP